MKRLGMLVITVSIGGLSSCMDQSTHLNAYEPYHYADASYFSESYSLGSYNGWDNRSGRQVTVPDTYYAGATHSPGKHKDLDKNWVSTQNPQGYTIEIAEGNKASQVAGKLFKAPKKNRMAQIKYNQNGGAYYKGVYGSYNSYEDAQKALKELPDDIKQGAGIKQWGSVQSNMSD